MHGQRLVLSCTRNRTIHAMIPVTSAIAGAMLIVNAWLLLLRWVHSNKQHALPVCGNATILASASYQIPGSRHKIVKAIDHVESVLCLSSHHTSCQRQYAVHNLPAGSNAEVEDAAPSIDTAEKVLDMAAETQRMTSLCAASAEVVSHLAALGENSVPVGDTASVNDGMALAHGV